MYFGGEPIIEGYGKRDVLLGNYPYYESSGDGSDATCDNGGQDLGLVGTSCTASLSTFGTLTELQSHQNSGDKWYQALPGCANGTGATVQSYNCGDSGYKISQNMTQRLMADKIFPTVNYNFTSSIKQSCDWNRMGDSKVDYTLTISHLKREPLFAGSSVWTYSYVDDTVSTSGVAEFNNSFERTDWTWTPTPTPAELALGCYVSMDLIIELDFIELDQLSRLIEEYQSTIDESFGLYITLELDNLRTDNGYLWSNVGYYNPFHGNNDSDVMMTLDFVLFDVDPMNTFVRFGVAAMGIGFWAIALASTPYWDPFIKKVKKE